MFGVVAEFRDLGVVRELLGESQHNLGVCAPRNSQKKLRTKKLAALSRVLFSGMTLIYVTYRR